MIARSAFNSLLIDTMSMKSKVIILWICIIALGFVGNFRFLSFIFLVRCVSWLFLFDDKGVYAINFAPVTKKTSVLGRYMFALAAFVLCLIVFLLSDSVVPHFYPAYISSGIYSYALMFTAYIVFASLELPLLYWQGYAKTRIYEFVILVAVMLFLARGLGSDFLYALNTGVNLTAQIVLPSVAAAIMLFLCSLLVSIRIYSKKDI